VLEPAACQSIAPSAWVDIMIVSFDQLYSPRWKIDETRVDIAAGHLSRTRAPLRVTRMGRGKFFLMDGNHRVQEHLMAGGRSYPAVLDEHIPDLTRTAGAYDSVIASAVLVASGLVKSNPGSKFDRWFGASRAVNTDGSPLRLYHGTSGKSFTRFKVSDGHYGDAVYLTTSVKRAEHFGGTDFEGSRVIPVYARVHKPLVVPYENSLGRSFWDALVICKERRNEGLRVAQWVQRLGYDSIFVTDHGKLIDVVVYDPRNIKSAIGNKGTYGKTATLTNPQSSYPHLSYASAHRWGDLAKARGVSQVARSGRGFMRAYQSAGSWSKLSDAWKRKRDGFIARHMAQVRSKNERLWVRNKSGTMVPSRRCLALIMWAYMPKGR